MQHVPDESYLQFPTEIVISQSLSAIRVRISDCFNQDFLISSQINIS